MMFLKSPLVVQKILTRLTLPLDAEFHQRIFFNPRKIKTDLAVDQVRSILGVPESSIR